MQQTLILASNSPRRKQLLALTGRTFEVLTREVDEDVLPGETPQDYVSRLAHRKAAAIGSQSDAIVLGFDTTVVDGDEILGKPSDDQDARAMLERLRGHTHTVYTALSVLTPEAEVNDLCASPVAMRDYSEVEVDAYVASGDPLDKAGAYAIQSPGFDPVEHFAHCFASVMGLPLCHLERSLRQVGCPAPLDIPQACQDFLQYDCPITREILPPEPPK